jgi:hypothetical protein
MTFFADAATGGYIAGNIAIAVIVICCVLGIAYAVFVAKYDTALGVGISLSILVISVPIYIFATWPFEHDYHHWIDKKVTVEKRSSRLLTDSDGNISQKFVVESGGTFYGVNDTRAALADEGDVLVLKCKRAYDYGVPRTSHGWDCKWNGRTR